VCLTNLCFFVTMTILILIIYFFLYFFDKTTENFRPYPLAGIHFDVKFIPNFKSIYNDFSQKCYREKCRKLTNSSTGQN
jgi:hypothetical protein